MPVDKIITFSFETILPLPIPPTTTFPAIIVDSALPFFPIRTLPEVRIVPEKSPSIRKRPLREISQSVRQFSFELSGQNHGQHSSGCEGESGDQKR